MTFIYTLTIFTSAFLLFLVQPMISKLLLPHLGGSPAVWNTSMMFFQTFLLLGYFYTHLTSKWLGARKQSVLHIVLLLVALAWLPISLKTNIDFSSSEYPIQWVIVSLFLSVGIPFFALAANAPLIQYWMANTNHKDAQNPYFLYSASNVASLIALLGYPFLIEPSLTLSNQTHIWSWLFVVFVGLIACSAYYLKKNYQPVKVAANAESSTADHAPTLRTKLYWIALSFGPSSLMLGLTTFITTDIASMPLFWVIPLTLYLITFILAFSKHNERITRYAIHAQNILVPMTVFVMIFEIHFLYAFVVLHLLTFFMTTMVCHGTLSGAKPSNTRYLTEYFVWISFGGMLGGVFNSLIAPNIFTDPIEYFVMFVGCLFLRPTLGKYVNLKREKILDFVIPAVFCVALILIFYLLGRFFFDLSSILRSTIVDAKQSLSEGTKILISNARFITIIGLYIAIMYVIDKTFQRPIRFSLVIISILSIILLPRVMGETFDGYLFQERNFFGVTKVMDFGDRILMVHGTTTHGIQSKDPKYKLNPVSYYAPLRSVFSSIHSSLRDHPYAVLGLGAGTLACIGKKNQLLDIYEIDPAVVKMASNPALFTYLRDCPTKHNIILGDGRLSLEKASNKRYSLIVMDAFTSDAVPMHLLTREALIIYKNKLADKGVIAFNISNRYLDLSFLLANLAKNVGLNAIYLDGVVTDQNNLEYPSNWVILTQDDGFYRRLASIYNPADAINLLVGDAEGMLWTDDYSNILETLY